MAHIPPQRYFGVFGRSTESRVRLVCGRPAWICLEASGWTTSWQVGRLVVKLHPTDYLSYAPEYVYVWVEHDVGDTEAALKLMADILAPGPKA